MSKIGFQTKAMEEQEPNNSTKTDQTENYKHTVKLFGIPVFTSTKKHVIDSNVVEK